MNLRIEQSSDHETRTFYKVYNNDVYVACFDVEKSQNGKPKPDYPVMLYVAFADNNTGLPKHHFLGKYPFVESAVLVIRVLLDIIEKQERERN